MDTTVLTPRQQGVLYALVEQMARHHEIKLAEAIAADRGASDEILDRMLYVGRDIKDAMGRYGFQLGLLRPLASAAHQLLAGDKLRTALYLTRKFNVECCDLHFPGVSDEPTDDDADANATQAPVGDLRIEFPDLASRRALLAALLDWSHLGLQYPPTKAGTIAKVAAVLEVPVPGSNEVESA